VKLEWEEEVVAIEAVVWATANKKVTVVKYLRAVVDGSGVVAHGDTKRKKR
jgi:hypothetical protein